MKPNRPINPEFVEYLYYRITDYKTDELQGRRFEKNMSKEIKWAVLGTGVIANEMAASLSELSRKETSSMLNSCSIMDLL